MNDHSTPRHLELWKMFAIYATWLTAEKHSDINRFLCVCVCVCVCGCVGVVCVGVCVEVCVCVCLCVCVFCGVVCVVCWLCVCWYACACEKDIVGSFFFF